MPVNRYEDPGVAAYWNEKYEKKYYPYLHGRQNKVLEAISTLNLSKGAKCLELGTGGGQNAVKYVELGFNVHGVDSSDELLQSAQKFTSHTNKLEFSNVDLNSKMPFDDASFDLVVVIGTLQYLMEPSACVKEVNRVLKPGGYFIVCQRNALSFNVLRRPISFLCCALSSEGFEWGGRNVATAIGTAEEGKKSVLIKRMVKFSNLQRWFDDADLELVHREGYTPDFSVAPRLFRLLNRILNVLPFFYKLSHVILATGKKSDA
jgi:SAM-dependent methyltransferase